MVACRLWREGRCSSWLERRGCPVLFSSPTCRTYSQPLESRVQLHVNSVQCLQVLPVLYVSVKKKERLSCGIITRWSLCPCKGQHTAGVCHVQPPSPTPLPTCLQPKPSCRSGDWSHSGFSTHTLKHIQYTSRCQNG